MAYKLSTFVTAVPYQANITVSYATSSQPVFVELETFQSYSTSILWPQKYYVSDPNSGATISGGVPGYTASRFVASSDGFGGTLIVGTPLAAGKSAGSGNSFAGTVAGLNTQNAGGSNLANSPMFAGVASDPSVSLLRDSMASTFAGSMVGQSQIASSLSADQTLHQLAASL